MPVRTIQPRNQVEINRNNPLGARTLALFNGINNYLHGPNTPMIPTGTPTFGVTPQGRAVETKVSNTFLKSDPVSGSMAPTELTLFWHGVVHGATGNGGAPALAAIWYNDTGTVISDSAGILRNTSDPTGLYFLWSNNGVGVLVSVAGMITYGAPASYVLSIKNGEAKGYKNGVQVMTSASASVITYSATSRFIIGGHPSEARNGNTSTAIAGYLRGGSTPEEVRSLTANPWQLFQPARSFDFRSIISGGNRRRRLLMAS